MNEGADSPFGASEAEHILKAGWRQGSPFQVPTGGIVIAEYDSATEWFVVCTQSCTVVSPRLRVDPSIEVVIAKALPILDQKSQEAKGRNVRRFHLPVSGIPEVAVFDCDINRRVVIPRQALLLLSPQAGAIVSAEDARNLAGWIARYYTRIALPDELVRRATRTGGLFDIVKKALSQKMTNSERVDRGIDGIYVHWIPEEELNSLSEQEPASYKIGLMFLCVSDDAERKLTDFLAFRLEAFTKTNGQDGIFLAWESKLTSSTFVSELAAYTRLSEWDYLSNLWDVAESRDKFSP